MRVCSELSLLPSFRDDKTLTGVVHLHFFCSEDCRVNIHRASCVFCGGRVGPKASAVVIVVFVAASIPRTRVIL